MLLAAFEPGKEMAFANFFLAIFCLFTVTLPLLLITRGDKTESNRDFLVATVNPWYQNDKEVDSAQVVVTEVKSTTMESELELVSKQEPLKELSEVISIEIKGSEELDESSIQSIPTDDEVFAA